MSFASLSRVPLPEKSFPVASRLSSLGDRPFPARVGFVARATRLAAESRLAARELDMDGELGCLAFSGCTPSVGGGRDRGSGPTWAAASPSRGRGPRSPAGKTDDATHARPGERIY